ncbi:hypothetical protein B5801_11155 [Gilliamella apicola]|nr:hypothetical protein B5801_11155 [Gilliamella apicola]
MKLLFSKRSPLSVQLFISLLLSIILIILDLNYRPFKEVRYYLDTMISPLYYISNAPKATYDSLYEMSKTREALIIDNSKDINNCTLRGERLEKSNFIIQYLPVICLKSN